MTFKKYIEADARINQGSTRSRCSRPRQRHASRDIPHVFLELIHKPGNSHEGGGG